MTKSRKFNSEFNIFNSVIKNESNYRLKINKYSIFIIAIYIILTIIVRLIMHYTNTSNTAVSITMNLSISYLCLSSIIFDKLESKAHGDKIHNISDTIKNEFNYIEEEDNHE